jgi:hypothetical protein
MIQNDTFTEREVNNILEWMLYGISKGNLQIPNGALPEFMIGLRKYVEAFNGKHQTETPTHGDGEYDIY